jgi:predicted metalloprotease with PDZ domain
MLSRRSHTTIKESEEESIMSGFHFSRRVAQAARRTPLAVAIAVAVLGVTTIAGTPAIAAEPSSGMLGVIPMTRSNHVIVTDLYIGAPAQSAGMQQGDQIVSINGRAITSAEEMTEVIAGLQPHQQVDLLVTRYGWFRHFYLTLAKREDVVHLRLASVVAAEEQQQSYAVRQPGYVDAIRARNIMDPYYRALYTNFR